MALRTPSTPPLVPYANPPAVKPSEIVPSPPLGEAIPSRPGSILRENEPPIGGDGSNPEVRRRRQPIVHREHAEIGVSVLIRSLSRDQLKQCGVVRRDSGVRPQQRDVSNSDMHRCRKTHQEVRTKRPGQIGKCSRESDLADLTFDPAEVERLVSHDLMNQG